MRSLSVAHRRLIGAGREICPPFEILASLMRTG
jgi:hypothetical protein